MQSPDKKLENGKDRKELCDYVIIQGTRDKLWMRSSILSNDIYIYIYIYIVFDNNVSKDIDWYLQQLLNNVPSIISRLYSWIK